MAKKGNEPPKFPEIGQRLTDFIDQSSEPNARQFALKAGLAPQLVSNLAAGYSMPSGETLIALAAAYKGFDALWLLTGKGTAPAAQLPPPVPSEAKPTQPGSGEGGMFINPKSAADEIAYWRTQFEQEKAAHERTRNQGHERETQLIVTISNLGKNEASADAADEYQAGPMAISHRGPEAETTYTYQRYQAQEAAPYKRVVVAGFAS